ncbi:MAG TPA: hypothetical protein VGN13_05405 [Solirubrobacteraceae bacterium]
MATIAGYLTGAAALLTTVATAVTASQQQLEGPGKWSAICGIAIIGLTGLGRQLQAAKLSAPAVTVPLPSDAEEAAPPQTATVPDGAAPAAAPPASLPAV